VSRTGDLFVADFLNQRVQRFTSAGVFGAVFGGSIRLSASVGYPPQALDALVDPNPMFVFAGETVSTTVRVTSVNAFQGQIALSAPQCCEDLVTRAWTANPVTPSFAPTAVSVPQNGDVDARLDVSAPAAATPGHVLVPIAAGNSQLGVGAWAGVAVQVLTPVPADTGVVSPCIGGTVVGSVGGGSAGVGPEVLPLSSVTKGLYTTKVGSPAKTSFTVAAAAASQRSGWTIMIDKASRPLRPDQAVVILNNTTAWDKGISTVNSGNCVAASQNARVSMGGSATILISRADTTTLLLNRQVCRFRFIGCWDSGGWQQFAVFDEGPFWSFFGGRQVTINWFNSSGE
jgi:hypothetical protein